MQDITKDEFQLLNGGCHHHQQKETLSVNNNVPNAAHPAIERIKLVRTPESSRIDATSSAIETVKLEDDEDAPDFFPIWHIKTALEKNEIESNLLCHSDDPLISGATDDNQNEFNPITTCDTLPQSKTVATTTSTTAPVRRKAPRTRRKNQFKLRFHHQALPPEYLDHYEATQNKIMAKERSDAMELAEQTKVAQEKDPKAMQTHETVRNWLHKISEYQQQRGGIEEPKLIDVIDTPAAIQPSVAAGNTTKKSRVVNYSDLPYMGEMTLENSKPRRGRKPKKTDICHLIYKNYGTIFPGTPHDLMDTTNEAETSTKRPDSVLRKPSASLLEKRLLEKDESAPLIPSTSTTVPKLKDEPLNLCVRDHSNDSMTISSDTDDETNDGRGSESQIESNRTTPCVSQIDATNDSLLAANLKMALPNFQSAMLDKSPSTPETPSTAGSDFNYWPQGGMFIHPMALYNYQKMIDGNPSTPSSSSSSTTKTKDHKLLVPKNIAQLMKPVGEKLQQDVKFPNQNMAASTNAPKRKRSAIFIPPMPSETSSNPATEVSICKFKFTGGAKPSLQEKKMLSVDSGGNFRYYSGTGDKSMRGYEFFPRESLQQSSLIAGSSAGAFLNTPGEKIDLTSPPSHGISNEVLQLPVELVTTPSVIVSCAPQRPTPSPSSSSSVVNARGVANTGDRRKRKSRRSLQREKLEQTFKEKGFLIQTQQLESAEGATYCKFRQLRKFTRYLFRSWKDYLPGDLQHGQAPPGAAGSLEAGIPPSVMMAGQPPVRNVPMSSASGSRNKPQL